MIAVLLRQVLERRGLRPRAFSEAAGIHYGTVLKIVAGRSVRIELETLDRMCAALNVKVGVLLARVPGKQDAKARPRRAKAEPPDVHPAGCRCYDCLFPRQNAVLDRLVREEHRASRWEDDRDG